MTNHLFVSRQEDTQQAYISFLQNKENELTNGKKIVKTQKLTFYCETGKYIYSFRYVKSSSGKLSSPLRDYLGLEKHKNMSLDFRHKLAMKASRTTYRKCSEDIHESFGFLLCAKTINKYVKKDAININLCQNTTDAQNILIADSTKVKNGKKGHHEVLCAISLDYEKNSSSLTAFGVNKIAKDISDKIDYSKYKAFVGDGDLALRNFFNEKLPFHLCHIHAIRDMSFFMWKDGLKKEERDKIMRRFEAILYTLQNSTKKYLKTKKKMCRLVSRIIWAKRELMQLAIYLDSINMLQASRYINVHSEHLMTASKLALAGIKCPFTTNHAERLMLEIGTRTKKKGMYWSELGLNAMLHMVLKRYFLPKNQRNYKEVFTNETLVVDSYN